MSNAHGIKRAGVLARKIGMTRVFDSSNVVIPVTLVRLEKNTVLSANKKDDSEYEILTIGFLKVKDKKLKKSQRGQFLKAGVDCFKILKQFVVSSKYALKAGESISNDYFVKNQYLDVEGVSIGKGFAGAMKRHNFAGLEQTHGVSISHRSHGSTGQCQDPGKVFKGKKMAGHLGNAKKTVQNIEIIDIDSELDLIALKGAIPGSKNSIICLYDAKKKAMPSIVKDSEK